MSTQVSSNVFHIVNGITQHMIFLQFFHIRKGQPEKILQEITGGRELRVVASLIAELHIKLFSVIKEDRGEK